MSFNQLRTLNIPLIPGFSLKGEGAPTCVDTHALRERAGERGYKWSSYFVKD